MLQIDLRDPCACTGHLSHLNGHFRLSLDVLRSLKGASPLRAPKKKCRSISAIHLRHLSHLNGHRWLALDLLRGLKGEPQLKHPAGCGIARVVLQILILSANPLSTFCLFGDVSWWPRILSFLKPNLPKPKRQRKIRRRFCPGLSSTVMRPVSSRLAQFFCTS